MATFMSKLNHDTIIICNSIQSFGCLGHCAAAGVSKMFASSLLFDAHSCITARYRHQTLYVCTVGCFFYSKTYLFCTTYLLIYLIIYFLPFSCVRERMRVYVCIAADLHTISICMIIILIILHFIALTFRLNALACIIIMVMGF